MDRIETREFAYFVAVAETLHFARAAELLGITQPPLSRAIARLERRLGVVLLQRTSRRVSLTPAGAAFLTESRAVLAAVDGAAQIARRTGGERRVVIAARPAAAPGVLSALLAATPGPDGGTTDVLFTYDAVGALRASTADIAVMCRSAAVPGLEMIDLGAERPVVLLPRDHPSSGRAVLALAEVEAMEGYQWDLPDESLDVIVDRVALGQLVVVVGDGVVERLGSSVLAVPVDGYPARSSVLAWFPSASSAVSHLTEAAREALAAGAA